MRLIQKYLPYPRHTEVHRIFVTAKPARAWETIRHFDMGQVPWIRLLFDIRTLPDKIKGKPREQDRRIGVDQITNSGTGFFVAEEVPGREVVVASVGKFWHLNISFADVTPEEFKDFNTPGYGKLSWSILVEPYEEGSVITLELRTTATDENSWKKLNRYYSVIGIASHLMRSTMMHQVENLLGKLRRPGDDDRAFPGDERMKNCRYQATHAIDIEAPPSTVWRYLMQLGCDRAGWYSIDALDNDGKPSIDHTVQGWEIRKPGDKLWATPKGDGFFEVYELEEQKHFILGGESQRLGEPFSTTWAFILEPIGRDCTHLVTRARMKSQPPVKEWLLGTLWMPPIHALMQKTQLKRLKRICERDAQMRINKSLVHERA
ncbi:MAG TPA: SRPBCC family protein [Chitinophagaceae bacterium]|nr:SRPBCC family protein [Chitinophagaceae bacterium]